MAELIRTYSIDEYGVRRKKYVYKCSKCGAEVILLKQIGDKNTYCTDCFLENKREYAAKAAKEREDRAFERGVATGAEQALKRAKEYVKTAPGTASWYRYFDEWCELYLEEENGSGN